MYAGNLLPDGCLSIRCHDYSRYAAHVSGLVCSVGEIDFECCFVEVLDVDSAAFGIEVRYRPVSEDLRVVRLVENIRLDFVIDDDFALQFGVDEEFRHCRCDCV